jgi:type VI protein secretion system component VasK
MYNRQQLLNGLVIVTGFVLLYLLFRWWPLLVVAGVVAAIYLLLPAFSFRFTQGWLWLGRRIGWLNQRIILSAIFFLLLTPISLLRRWIHRKNDPLRLKPPVQESTFENCNREFSSGDFKHPF